MMMVLVVPVLIMFLVLLMLMPVAVIIKITAPVVFNSGMCADRPARRQQYGQQQAHRHKKPYDVSFFHKIRHHLIDYQELLTVCRRMLTARPYQERYSADMDGRRQGIPRAE